MIVAWTGHRPEIFHDPEAARLAVASATQRLVADASLAPLSFLVGGQRGVDTWAALRALQQGISYAVVLPLESDVFAAGWDQGDRATLQRTLDHATHVSIVGGDSGRAHTERNRSLVEGSGLLIAVWTRTMGGGTDETVCIARALGRRLEEVVLPAAPGAAQARGRGL